MPNDGLSMGYSEGDQQILDSLHKKLNRGEAVEQPKAAAPLPTPATPRNVPLDVAIDEPNPQPADQPVEGVEPVEGQPAEGQTAEGDAPVEGEPPPTLKITLKGDDGKDVETEVPIDEVRSGYMRHADYTRKTQQLATERKQIPQKLAEAERFVQDKSQQFSQALQNLEAFVVQSIAPELQNVNWQQLAQENPNEYVRLNQRAQQTNATLQQIRNYQKDVAKQSEQQRVKSMQESAAASRETLNREIPGGWNDDLYAKLQKGAVNHYGFVPEEIGNVVDARIIMAIHDGLKYRELQSGKPLTQQRLAQAPQLAVRPGAAPTGADKRQSAVEKARETARKSGSVDDALALMQAKRARTAR